MVIWFLWHDVSHWITATSYDKFGYVILSKQQTTKVLIRLPGCAGWSMPLLFAYGIRHVFAWPGPNEPSHEIMVLFVLCKLIFQTCMRSHPAGLDVWFLVGPFVYFHTCISCVRTAKALVRLRRCASSPEPSLVAYVISTIISWAGSNEYMSYCYEKLTSFLPYKKCKSHNQNHCIWPVPGGWN